MYENTAELRKALKAQNPLEPPSERLLATGLATGRCHQGHDQVLDCLFTEQAEARKSEIVGNFLVGVERNEASLRAAMSAFACATHLPKHPFTVHDQLTCQVCSAFEQIDVNFMQLNRVRFFVGAVLGGDILHIAFMLQEHNAAAKLRPENFDLMVSVIDLIRNVPAPTKPKELLKLLRKLPGIKMSEEEGRGFLDLLGHCGILQTPEHPGLLYRYTNLGLAPRSARSSDWSYPMDFWRGEHGLNQDALHYWFSDYPELLKA
ncbi:hypothetical protein [Pseudomonas soli]|uniref:Uncharacterized protein n=1 Tax=Pseudomonas soli TaxID=1306993 RepID=A0A2V4HW45_9PSED|nr:hypothetical protein [Pseudomonas soli]PYB82388.1 hypothetical protein DMX07_12020 [Pseudomonas soli]